MLYKSTPDGLIRLKDFAPLLIFELKKFSGDPLSQAICDYIRFVFQKGNLPYQTQLLPCFLLAHDGRGLNLFIACFTGTYIDVEHLGGLYFASIDDLDEKLIYFVQALRNALDSLTSFYQKSIPTPMEPLAPFFEIKDPSSDHILALSPLTDNDLVFIGESPSHSKYLLKICREKKYGIEAHEFLHGVNAAPRLINVDHDSIYGHWIVVMEFLEDYLNFPDFAKVRQDKFDVACARLRQTVEAMHGAGYVHGDLRECNVMVNLEGEVKLVDLNWSGKEGSARYPLDINTRLDWHQDVKPGGLIKKEHDIFQIDLLAKHKR